MRVLHYLQRWLPISESYVAGLIATSRHEGIVVSRHRLAHRTAFPHRPVYSLGAIPRLHWPQGAMERRAITASLVAIGRRHDISIVHHHHGYRLGDCDNAAVRLHAPVVISVHGHDVTSFIHKNPGWYMPRLVKADAVVVPSRFLADVVAGLGVQPDRIHVLPAGVDTTWFTPSALPDARAVAFVGRFVEKKGLDVLLAAWPLVRRAVADATLRIVGQGPLEPVVDDARSSGITVEPTNPLARAEQVRDVIRAARVVVTPSRTAADGDAETLLLVNLEAQASARPVVTTRHGGIPEYVVDDGTALVVAEADVEALADALIRVLTDDGLATRLGAAGPSGAAQFDVRACTRRVDELYERLAG
jgi:glycosyltransferase involved in cell wall biosynthesis